MNDIISSIKETRLWKWLLMPPVLALLFLSGYLLDLPLPVFFLLCFLLPVIALTARDKTMPVSTLIKNSLRIIVIGPVFLAGVFAPLWVSSSAWLFFHAALWFAPR